MEENRILSSEDTTVSPYVTLSAKTIDVGGNHEVFHSLKLADYVTILAIDESGQIPLVKQFRPALNRISVELPGGILDNGEKPATCASRELYEETGYLTSENPSLLGQMDPDSGRLENTLWAYFSDRVVLSEDWRPEPGVERITTDKNGLLEAIADGSFSHALHIAVIGLALATARI